MGADSLNSRKLPDPDGAGGDDAPEMEYVYDAAGQLTKSIDALDRETTYEYDARNRLIKITQPDPDGGGPLGTPITQFTYDDAGNRTSLTDPEGNTTQWFYDGLNRVIEERITINSTPLSRTFEYDAVGNLTQKTDRNGRVTEYEFDNLYRLIEERWLDNTPQVIHTINYDYDLAGQMVEVSDAYATYGYNYDGLGRQTQITMNLANLADEVVLTQAFDANSRRTSLAASLDATDDFLNGYLYDNLGRLTRATQQGQMSGNAVAEKRADFTYRGDGSFDTITRYADIAATDLVVTSTYGYDLTGRLTSLSHAKDTTTFAGYAWTWDAANRITSFTNSEHSNEDATYNYDATGQLTDADYDSLTDEEYTYDDNGNRTNAGYSTGDNNQLLSDGTFTYTYDDEGNRLTRTRISSDPADDYKTEYEWDHRNRLTKVTFRDNGNDVTKIVAYSYDAFNRWIGKQVDDNGDEDFDRSEAYVYDGNQIALRFADATDQPLDDSSLANRYLWGPVVDQLLADEAVTSLASAGDVLWTASDHQNTIRDWLEYDSGMDETTVAGHAQYDSFGNRLDVPAIDTFFGYTGRSLDVDTGLQNNWHRWYDASLGRWLSVDPIQDDVQNTYRYANNSPTNNFDPTGLATKQHWMGVAYKNAGLSASWDPSKSTFNDNRANMVKIYQSYARYYNSQPDRLLWAGLATHAGRVVIERIMDKLQYEAKIFHNEFMEHTRAIANLSLVEMYFEGVWRTFQADVLATQIVIRHKILTIVPQMAKDIFDDLGWQHEAYLNGGMKEMSSLYKAGDLTQEQYQAWCDIDSGDPKRVEAGTNVLAKIEQVFSLRRGYSEIRNIDPFGIIPGVMSEKASSGLKNVPTFLAAVPGGDITDINPNPNENERYQWIQNFVVPNWSSLSAERRRYYVNLATDFFAMPAPTP